jgi:putative transposase
MRTSKFTPEQMVHILRQGDSGVPVVELCRQHGISEQTYYLYGLLPACKGNVED